MTLNFMQLTESKDFKDPDLSNVFIHSRLAPSKVKQRTKLPSFKLVVEGEEIYRIGNRDIRVSAGEMLFVKSGVVLEVSTAPERDTTGMCYYFGGAGYELFDEPYFKIELSARLQKRAAELNAAINAGAACADEINAFKNELVQFGVKSLCRLATLSEKTNLLRHSTRADITSRLERTRTYIRRNAAKPISLEELSEVAGLSKFYLAHHYRRVYAVSPMRDHQNARMHLAARLLQTQDFSLESAAHAVGYSDFASFAKAFKRCFGQPPGAYRDNIGANTPA
jgi:AraC-like DNA-binding protein